MPIVIAPMAKLPLLAIAMMGMRYRLSGIIGSGVRAS